ncbi:hypothetical protein AVEN_228166-1 [Araneus ventricosus]|uniref:Tc1-like transposase DDE domain-containing protein n=1 Tax=Araneus ventricosus TaxID=182803 RepID=A0A4Y2CV21_ARAVE|nr:hypothetical protein AVEN_228166-1 [Araneus ventricosus]
MNQHVYFNILDDLVLPFSQHLHDEYALVTPIFQDDNSAVHRAGRICDWFDELSNIPLHLDWPVKSPDITNPNHLIITHRKSVGHVGTAGKTPKSASPKFCGFARSNPQRVA